MPQQGVTAYELSLQGLTRRDSRGYVVEEPSSQVLVLQEVPGVTPNMGYRPGVWRTAVTVGRGLTVAGDLGARGGRAGALRGTTVTVIGAVAVAPERPVAVNVTTVVPIGKIDPL